MKVQTIVKVELTKEEYDILDKACEILGKFEMDANDEEVSALQNKYMESIDYVEHDYALPTVIDFITMLLTEHSKNK